MSQARKCLGASGLLFLLASWALDLKMLAPFLFLGHAEGGRMRYLRNLVIVLCLCLFGAGCASTIKAFTPGATRKSNYIESHPELSQAEAQQIAKGTIWIGMTKEQAIASWGQPRDVNRTGSSFGISEQWCYGEYGEIPDYYLYFENGILTSWQD